MHRLARVILAVVGLFVVVLAVTLVARSRTARLESVGDTPSSADLTIKEVQVEEETGRVRWRLKAEQAQIFDQEGRTTLKKIVVDVQEPDRSWTIVGDEGDLFQKTKNVEVRRNVVVTSNDGFRLETAVLRWHGAQKRLWTDAPVTLTRQRTVIRGTALEVLIGDEATRLDGPVHAVFARGPR